MLSVGGILAVATARVVLFVPLILYVVVSVSAGLSNCAGAGVLGASPERSADAGLHAERLHALSAAARSVRLQPAGLQPLRCAAA